MKRFANTLVIVLLGLSSMSQGVNVHNQV